MAGRIRDEDIAEVREKARIDDVVSSYVTLRSAGGGSMKGLCPFHDEKSPSFNVTPSKQMWYCFGCGAGGDVIKFVMEIDGLGFTETVERLAEKYGVQLRYEEGGPARPKSGPQRPRLVEAHKLTAEWYAELLAGPEALTARQFLSQRGFDSEAAAHFGVGFSPRGGEDLTRHLRQKGFTDEELVAAGLAAQGQRGLYDRFRGRLMWPIRDSSGDTIGFGARRIFDDDRIEAKYLNTSETPIYKKSQVLYGIDLARREIARASQAVIVEGYTDVMACHLSGVKTAVATCGTAFGDDHARVIRRLLQDHDEFRGEVIFTFDGDAAGQKAALRAFEGDQNFAGQTYVAVEPTGMDPCDLRLASDDRAEGEAAVRELVARRIPLYRFVLANVVQRYDLDRADGRIDALREAAKLVTSIRDRSKVDAFARELAGMVGVEPTDVQREVRRAAGRAAAPHRGHPPAARGRAARPARPAAVPRARDAQAAAPAPRPWRCERSRTSVPRTSPTAPTGRCGPASSRPAARATTPAGPRCCTTRQEDERLKSLISSLTVEPLSAGCPTRPTPSCTPTGSASSPPVRRIADVKSRLQRTNPVEEAAAYNKMFGELVALESHARGAARAGAGEPVKLFSRSGGLPAEVAARAGLPRGERAARLGGGAATGPGCSAPATGWCCCSGDDEPRRVPWEQVEDARWDAEESRLRITEIGEYGAPRPAYDLVMEEPALLLQLLRERVTASIVLQRRVPVQRPARPDRDRPTQPDRRAGALDARLRRRSGPRRPGRRRRRGPGAGPGARRGRRAGRRPAIPI